MPKVTFQSYSAENPDIFNCEHLIVDDLTNLLTTLQKYGAAIISSLVSCEECEQAIELSNQFFRRLTEGMETPFDPTNPATYATIAELQNLHSMLFQGYGVGQSQAAWNIRQNSRIFEAFSAIWGTSELLTSMDGMSFHIPPELIPSRAKLGKDDITGYFQNTWFHTDQSYLRSGFECIQGQVPAYDVNAGDATLCFLEGSHQHHAEFRERFGMTGTGDWFMLESNGKERGRGYLDFYRNEKACPIRRIVAPRGSLVLWDSRTIHCGAEPLLHRPQPNYRCTFYVCMTPRCLCGEESMQLRKIAFQEMCTTSHWPHRVKIFPTLKTGRFVKNPDGVNMHMEYPILTELGRHLLLGADGVHEFDALISKDDAEPDERPRVTAPSHRKTPRVQTDVMTDNNIGTVKDSNRLAAEESTSKRSRGNKGRGRK